MGIGNSTARYSGGRRVSFEVDIHDACASIDTRWQTRMRGVGEGLSLSPRHSGTLVMKYSRYKWQLESDHEHFG